MAYQNLDDMYEDLGQCRQQCRINYSLLGETNHSEVVLRGVKPGSSYAKGMRNPVLANGLLYDREEFHGTGTVLIHSVQSV